MGLVASSAPLGWRRQRRIDGGMGRIGLDWRFIYLEITIFSNYFCFFFLFFFFFCPFCWSRSKYGELSRAEVR